MPIDVKKQATYGFICAFDIRAGSDDRGHGQVRAIAAVVENQDAGVIGALLGERKKVAGSRSFAP